MSNKKEVIIFRKLIAPGEKLTFEERIKENGTIESVKLRFYSGQEMNLKVYPFVRHTGNRIENFTTSPTNEPYIMGDDDAFVFDVVIPVWNDDTLTVMVENASLTYSYNMVCDITVDYYSGTDRVVGGVV